MGRVVGREYPCENQGGFLVEYGCGLTIKVKVRQKKETQEQGKEMRPNSGIVLPSCRGEAKSLGWERVAS